MFLLAFCLYSILMYASIVLFYYMHVVRTKHCKCLGDMQGKTVVITGATSGIGEEIAVELARRGARIIFTSRDFAKAVSAQKRIIAASKNNDVSFRQLEMTSFNSVLNFTQRLKKTVTKIDVLINNAGTADIGNFMTEDGVAAEAQINYYAPFLMTRLLLDLMKQSAPSRIINVSSALHHWGRIHPITFDHPVRGFWARKRIFASCKLATVMFTMKLSRELAGTGVTVNCFNPGLVNTKHWGKWSWPMRLLNRFMMRKPRDGAQTAVHLAVAKSLENVTGRYFEDCQQSTASALAMDPMIADRLWRSSERVVGMRDRNFCA